MELERFSDKYDNNYPTIIRIWRNKREKYILFAYSNERRKFIYTTNTIKFINSVISKAVNNKKYFLMTRFF